MPKRFFKILFISEKIFAGNTQLYTIFSLKLEFEKFLCSKNFISSVKVLCQFSTKKENKKLFISFLFDKIIFRA